MAQGLWCHVRWGLQCSEPEECGWWGWAAEQGSSIPCLSALLTACCRGRSSPDPSGVGPVPGHSCCRQERGHRLVEEEVVLEGGRVRGLARAAWLVPGHPVSLVPACHAGDAPQLSQAGQAHLLSPPVGRSPCLLGQGGRRLLVHSPPHTRGWWDTGRVPQARLPLGTGGDMGRELEGAMSCRGCVQRAPSSPSLGGLSSTVSTLCTAGQPRWGRGSGPTGQWSWERRIRPPREAMPGKGSCSVGTRGGWPGAAPTHVNELLLLLLCHLAEAVVPACQVSSEAVQCLHSHLLHLSPLSAGAGWRQAQPTDAAPSPDPGREHVALIEVAKLYLEQTGAMEHLRGSTDAGRGPVP